MGGMTPPHPSRAPPRALLGVFGRPAAAWGADVYSHAGWAAPRLHAEGRTGWGRAPGVAMKPMGGGWWHSATAGSVGEFLFNDGRGRWDHAPWPTGPNYTNQKSRSELWVRGGRVTYAPPGAGRIEEHRVPSRVLGQSRRVTVYLPALYDIRKSHRYPVLYLQDGQNLFDPRAFFGGWDADGAIEGASQAGDAEQRIQGGGHNTGVRESVSPPTRAERHGGGRAGRAMGAAAPAGARAGALAGELALRDRSRRGRGAALAAPRAGCAAHPRAAAR